MSEDELYLVVCLVVFILTLIFHVFRSKRKVQTTILNIGIAGAYYSYFLYNLEHNSAGGAGLVWFVYLLLSIGLHWLFLVALIIKTYIRKQ